MNDLAKMYQDLLQQGVPAPEIPATIARIASQAAQYKQRLLANGYPQSYVDGLSSQELFNLGQSGALPLTTGSADLNREAEGRRDAETALGNRSGAALSLAAILAQEARDKAAAQNDTFRLPEALANLSGVSGSASPLQTLIGEGKYIDAQYTPDPMLAELKARLMTYANPVPPSATDARVYAAYDEDPVRAEKFFGRPDPRGNASGGYQRLNKPVTVFDVSGKPVATGAENGPEMMRVDRGGVRFKPLPGVSQKLPSWRPQQIAQTTMASLAERISGRNKRNYRRGSTDLSEAVSGPVDMGTPYLRNSPPPLATTGPVDMGAPYLRTASPPLAISGPPEQGPVYGGGRTMHPMYIPRTGGPYNGYSTGDMIRMISRGKAAGLSEQEMRAYLMQATGQNPTSGATTNVQGNAAGGHVGVYGAELKAKNLAARQKVATDRAARNEQRSAVAARDDARAAALRSVEPNTDISNPAGVVIDGVRYVGGALTPTAGKTADMYAHTAQQTREQIAIAQPRTNSWRDANGVLHTSSYDAPGGGASVPNTPNAPSTPSGSNGVSLRAATAIALGKALQGNPFAHPDMVAALLSGNPPPPGSITQRFRNNVDPVILETLMNSVMPAFGFRGADVTAEARRFDPQGLSYTQVSR